MKILDPLLIHDYTARTSSWLSAPRPRAIRLITIHTTRGGSSGYRVEYAGTITWSRSPNNNQGGWGSSEQRVVQGRDVAIIVSDSRMATYGAGYAGPGSVFAVDEYSLNLEIAQMTRDTPIESLTFDTAARQCAAWCIQYGIPVVRIPYLPQHQALMVRGFVGHEDTGNGRVLGKSDPGPMFDWPGFLTLVKKYVQEETDPLPPLPLPLVEPAKEEDMPVIIMQSETPPPGDPNNASRWVLKDGLYRVGLSHSALVALDKVNRENGNRIFVVVKVPWAVLGAIPSEPVVAAQVVGVDVAAIARAVADEQYRRQKE